MQTLEIRDWDDLHFMEGAEKVPATKKGVRLSYQGREVELDLTDAHAQELDNLLARWMKAGHDPAQGVVMTRKHKAGSAEAREFYAALRAWAKAVGRDSEHWTQGKGGRDPQYYYPRGLVKDYEAYLLGQAERQAS